MPETDEQKAAREAAEAEAAAAAEVEAKAKAEQEAEAAAAREAELAALSPEERAAKEAEEAAAAEAAKKAAEAGAVEGETVVQIGDAEPPKQDKAPSWVTDLRKRNRELEKKVRTLEAAQGGAEIPKLGAKPTLADHDYDEVKFAAALDKWHEQKRVADDQAAKLEQQQQQQQTAWNGKLESYGQGKALLKVPDFDDAEALAQETLSDRQQAIIVKCAKNPALVVYALGKNPGKLKELAGIGDLAEFTYAVANLEAQLKITTKKAAPPPPEKKLDTASTTGALDNQLERLRAEAEKTGDYSKVHAYRNSKKAA